VARARNIKPGFFRNADLVELPVETRLCFIGLWTLCDREGRLEDRPKQIKMELFPADPFDVGAMLDQLQESGFVVRYEVDGSKFIEVVNFIKHQDPHYKEKASEIPPRPGAENFMRATGVTRTQRARILERDGHACKACGAVDALCIDHIIPVSRGGDSSDGNLQVLCSACNTKKGNKIGDEDKNLRQRRVDVERHSAHVHGANPGQAPLNPSSLIPESLIPDSLIPELPPTEDAQAHRDLTKAELWASGKSLLESQGMAKAQCGTFVGKLVKDYGDQIVVEAVRVAVVQQPADAASFLKATCKAMKTPANRESFKDSDRRKAAENIAAWTGGLAHDRSALGGPIPGLQTSFVIEGEAYEQRQIAG
jgi:hypothetical protein